MEADEQKRILALARLEVNVAATKAIYDERERISVEVGSGGTMGPVPSSFVTQVTRNTLKEASTYAFQFGNENAWKIGWAHSPAERLRELNKHIPFKIVGQQWGGGWTQKWASAEQAYNMEQRIFCQFPNADKEGEQVYCSKEQLEAAWRNAWTDLS